MHQFLLTFALSALGSIILATGLASLAGRLGFPLPGDTGRLGAVDGLRGYLALSVMLQVMYFKYTRKKYGEGRRFFKMAPLHHHFEKQGWKETQVVVRFWIITMLLCLLGLSTLKLR